MIKRIFNKYTIIGLGLVALFMLMLILVKFVDRAQVGDAEVGLASLNKAFLVSGVYTMWDSISDGLLYLMIILGGVVVVTGVFQFLTKYKLKDVNLTFIIYVIGLAVIVLAYLFFDKVVFLNNRPNLVSTTPESSFPSSHVLLSTYLALVLPYIFIKLANEKWMKYVAIAAGAVVIILMALGRILSGYHYLTDVVASIIFSSAVFFLVVGFDKAFSKIKEPAKETKAQLIEQ